MQQVVKFSREGHHETRAQEPGSNFHSGSRQRRLQAMIPIHPCTAQQLTVQKSEEKATSVSGRFPGALRCAWCDNMDF